MKKNQEPMQEKNKDKEMKNQTSNVKSKNDNN